MVIGKRKRIMDVDWGRGRGLPPDISKVIFSKLPISNLPACKLVCKTWNHLLLDYANSSSSKFILPNAFLLTTADCDPNSDPRSRWFNPKMRCIDIRTMTSVDSFGFDGDWSSVVIFNSCNGLLFIGKSTYDILCHGILNPMTREFFKLPGPDLEDIYFFGFGFSPKTKQYKLLRVNSDKTEFSSAMEVFRFGRNGTSHNHNQWRPLYFLPFAIYYHGAYLDGVIYWIGKEKEKENEYVIYALDVETEILKLIAVLEVGPYSRQVVIQPFNGSVYATFFMYPAYFMHPATSKIQVWMMQEKDSWIRKFVIDDIPNDWVLEYRNTIFFHLVKALEDGEIFCKINHYLFCLYNPRTGRKRIKTLNLNGVARGVCDIESLNFGSLSNILAGDY